MPTYKITDPQTGKTIKVTGDSPPSEAELNDIFATAKSPTQEKDNGGKLPGLLSTAGNFVAGGTERLGKGLGNALSAVTGEQKMIGESNEINKFQSDKAFNDARAAYARGDKAAGDRLMKLSQESNQAIVNRSDEAAARYGEGKLDVIKGGVQTAATVLGAGVTPSSSVLKAAGTGVATGAAAGFGQSETGNEVGDTLIGGVTGGVLSGVMQGAGNKLGGKTFMGEVVPTKKAAGIEIPVEFRTTADEKINNFINTLDNVDETELRVPRTLQGKTIQNTFNLSPTEARVFRSAETSEELAKNGFLKKNSDQMQKRAKTIIDSLNGFVKGAIGETSPVPPKAVARVANDVDNLLEVGMANGMTEKQATVIETMLQRSLGIDKNGTVNQIDAVSLLDFQKNMQKLKSEVSFSNPHYKELRAIYQGAADASQEAIHDAISASPNAQAVIDGVKNTRLLNKLRQDGYNGLAEKLQSATSYQDIRSAMAPFVRTNQILGLLEEKGVKGAGVARSVSKAVGAGIGSLFGGVGAMAGAVIAPALDPVTEAVVSFAQPKLSGSVVQGVQAIGNVGASAANAGKTIAPGLGNLLSQPGVQQGVIRSTQQEGGGGLGLDIGRVPPKYSYK